MKKFILNGQPIDFNLLLRGKHNCEVRSDFERTTLAFIKSWASGQREFHIKTSGSTGPPKTMKFSREKMELSAQRTIKAFNLNPGGTVLSCLNTKFIAGIMMLVRAFEGDLNLIIKSPMANPLAQVEPGENLDFVALTPYQIKHALAETRENLSGIRTILIGGSELSLDLEQQLQTIKSSIYHSYGMTETLTHVALRNVNGPGQSEIYHALEGVSFAQDKRRCLIVNDHHLDIKKLITNDIVELLDDKSFRWLGRYDNVINSGGIKIQVEHVETVIQAALVDLGINQPICLLSIPDPLLTNKPVLLIQSDKKSWNEEAILEVLKQRLPKYHNPKKILIVPRLIRTESGKIDRKGNSAAHLQNLNFDNT